MTAPRVRLEVTAPFDRLGAVRRLVRPPVVTIESESYGAGARLVLRLEKRREAELRAALAGLGVAAETPATPARDA